MSNRIRAIDFTDATTARLQQNNQAQQMPPSPASPLAVPAETARAEVNAAYLMTPGGLAPHHDGLYVIGSVAAKIGNYVKSAAKISGMGGWGFWLILILAFSSSGCLDGTQVVSTTDDTQAIVDTPADLDQNNIVCDPFGATHVGSDLDHGIIANLKYLSDDQPRYTTVVDYQTNAHPVDATLFFGSINIPTRPFDLGFTNTSGETILNANGNTLYEYFSLHFESTIRLTEADAVGNYQFALLADDGANLMVDDGTGFKTLVNDDGTHPTKMTCSTTPVTLDLSSRLPIKLDYYQGPRYHIAAVLLWRPWSDDPAFDPNDPECGKSGNSHFFDSTQTPSAPQTAYNNLLARGWKPVAPANFHLPDYVAANPCQTEELVTTSITGVDPAAAVTNQTWITFEFNSNKPTATFKCVLDGGAKTACVSPMNYTGVGDGVHHFEVHAVDNGVEDTAGAVYSWTVDTVLPQIVTANVVLGSDTATVNWTTNKPTTTTLYWGLGADTSNQVPEDSVYSTNHSVTITGLTPDTIYSFRMAGHDQVGNFLFAARRSLRTNP